jgi:kynurenine formamidase
MIIENLANLTELPTRAQVVVAPIKLARGNGGPARIFALLPNGHNGQ